MTAHNAEDVRVVCPYCVQWRCACCKSMDWPTCCDKAQITADAEPFWPNGTVAVLTQDETCPRCARAIDEYIGWEQSDGSSDG